MIHVVLVIHLILAVAIIGLVLLQKSEGGGVLGSAGGGIGSFATPKSAASIITRATWGCAAAFFVTSLILGILYNQASSSRSILDQLDKTPVAAAPAVPGKAAPETAKEKTPAKEVGKEAGKEPEPHKPAKTEPSVPVTP